MDMAKKRKIKRESDFFLISKAKIDKIQQNRKCRSCGDRVETINYMITEYNKLA